MYAIETTVLMPTTYKGMRIKASFTRWGERECSIVVPWDHSKNTAFSNHKGAVVALLKEYPDIEGLLGSLNFAQYDMGRTIAWVPTFCNIIDLSHEVNDGQNLTQGA